MNPIMKRMHAPQTEQARVADLLLELPLDAFAKRCRDVDDKDLVEVFRGLPDAEMVRLLAPLAAELPKPAPQRSPRRAPKPVETPAPRATSAKQPTLPGVFGLKRPKADPVDAATIDRVLAAIRDAGEPIAPGLLGARTSLAVTTVAAALRKLSKSSAVTKSGRGKATRYSVAA